MKRKPTVVFSEWAESGRDERMAQGHQRAVANMLEYSLKDRKKYRFIDAGCGNGWVVRQLKGQPDCIAATGVDGAPKMIEKAKSLDAESAYFHVDLEHWSPQQKVDVVHSMEVVYYLQDPRAFIQNVYTNWLNTNGRLIIGLDFYKENPISHSWPEDCGVSIMRLLSEKDWISYFEEAGFDSVENWRVDPKEGWAGTLVITAIKTSS